MDQEKKWVICAQNGVLDNTRPKHKREIDGLTVISECDASIDALLKICADNVIVCASKSSDLHQRCELIDYRKRVFPYQIGKARGYAALQIAANAFRKSFPR